MKDNTRPGIGRPAPTQQEINEAAKEARQAELEAVSQTMAAPEPPPIRTANSKNLAKALMQFEKVEKAIADTQALRTKLEKSVADAIASGDMEDERLVASLSTKRNQIELIPAKLAQLETARAAAIEELQAEFIPCMNELEHRFDGMLERIRTKVVAFLQPLMADDALTRDRVETLIMPYTKPAHKAAGLVNYIRFPSLQGNWADAARQWLRRESEANEIVAWAEAFATPAAKA